MKIAVIGAGPAGLAFAKEFLKNDINGSEIIILEKDAVCGGISRTVQFGANRMDIGGHRFLTKNERINRFWRETMPEMKWRDRRSSIFYEDSLYEYPLKPKWKTVRQLGARRIFSILVSIMISGMRKLPENSLENFYINRFGKTLYQMFFESYTQKVWGRHPSELSAQWGAQRVKGLSLVKALLDSFGLKSREISLSDRFLYPDFGPGQFFEKLLDDCAKLGAKYFSGHRVCKLSSSGNGKTRLACETKGGQSEFEADIVVSAMPIKEAADVLDMPSDIYDMACSLSYRDFLSVGILIPPESKAADFSENWIYIQKPEVKMGRIQFFRNWSPVMCEDICLGLEYFCDSNNPEDIWKLDDESILKIAAAELEALGMTPHLENPKGHVERMPMAYPVYSGSFVHMDKIKKWLLGKENFYCIGRNGQHRYNNMDHSMLTGILTADLLLGKDVSKESIWNVNNENKYLENK